MQNYRQNVSCHSVLCWEASNLSSTSQLAHNASQSSQRAHPCPFLFPISIFACRTPDVKVCTENQVGHANGVPLQQAVYVATGLLVFKMISTYVPGVYL